MVADAILLQKIIPALSGNKAIFQSLLSGLHPEQYTWKPEPSKWCLLEVICHLYDEEREDFRTRLKHLLNDLPGPFPPIDPQGWVKSRNYMEQPYEEKLSLFMKEREQSINWLQSLSAPKLDKVYEHPSFGTMSARMFLSNWLAHDYLHIRQITRLKFEYLQDISGEKLEYAGTW